MFGFTLSWCEIVRTTRAVGDVNILPLEFQGLTTTDGHIVDLFVGYSHHGHIIGCHDTGFIGTALSNRFVNDF